MSLDRREFLEAAGAAALLTLTPGQAACRSEPQVRPGRRRRDECAEVREGPATLPHVTLYTPLEVRLAAGIV